MVMLRLRSIFVVAGDLLLLLFLLFGAGLLSWAVFIAVRVLVDVAVVLPHEDLRAGDPFIKQEVAMPCHAALGVLCQLPIAQRRRAVRLTVKAPPYAFRSAPRQPVVTSMYKDLVTDGERLGERDEGSTLCQRYPAPHQGLRQHLDVVIATGVGIPPEAAGVGDDVPLFTVEAPSDRLQLITSESGSLRDCAERMRAALRALLPKE